MRGHEAGQGKNLLLNPGGPGGSGLEFLYRKGEIINSIVGEGYHLLAFDPRGVNTSTPQALCYPDKETQEKLKTVRDKYPVEDSPELFAWTENFVQGCIDTTGEHGKYINTPQTAADMNSILDAVGQEKMAYWGFSYGTILGQTYATLYPERSERVIIDGVANLFDWYEANFDIEMFADTDHIFDSFFDECAKAGDRCALSEFGATGEMIQAQFMVIADALKRQPAPVYINASLHGLLDYETLLYQAFFPSLYKPALWHELAQDVASLMRGNATDFFLAHAVGSAFNLEGDALTFVSANDGQSGPSFWPQSRRDLLSDILPFLNVSMFAPTENSYYYRKSKWPLPKTHDFHPKRSVETSSPLLILSTTYDPVCPLRSAKVAEGAFEGSKLVEVLGYGHCSISMPSSCLAGHVRKFLNDGELPDTDKQCEVDIPYFLPPDEQKLFLEEMLGNGYDARKLYSAQLELAREMTWSRR
jgi:pimeloyl-ACP methyl ester carboxylesterase